jgi:decaprenylphospho-beta-D-ribofuranose 2-oxidase
VFSDDADGFRLLTGWGRTSGSAARVVTPERITDVPGLAARAGSRGLLARGLGSSYGDASQNAGGLVIDLTRCSRILDFDRKAGMARVESGVSLMQLLRTTVPAGWFVPVSPGTQRVTVGGMLAADVHGKNHHRDGSIGRHVSSLRLALADGSVRDVSSRDDPDLFWATLGGMGLTGLILEATLELVPIRTARVAVTEVRADDLDGVLEELGRADEHTYSVAWIDCANGGRGVVSAGEHAEPSELTAGRADESLRFRGRMPRSVPGELPCALVNRMSIAAFNRAWFAKAPTRRSSTRRIRSIRSFFYPLDALAGWNRLYGPRGFIQYQFVVPTDDGLRDIVRKVRASRTPVALAVLKRFGPATPGPLSFPRPGWTLAMDIPASVSDLGSTLDALDERVAAQGGSVYLAKDARMRPEHVAQMYPGLNQFNAVRDRVDPDRRFGSDLSRRLGL